MCKLLVLIILIVLIIVIIVNTFKSYIIVDYRQNIQMSFISKSTASTRLGHTSPLDKGEMHKSSHSDTELYALLTLACFVLMPALRLPTYPHQATTKPLTVVLTLSCLIFYSTDLCRQSRT